MAADLVMPDVCAVSPDVSPARISRRPVTARPWVPWCQLP
jgi:hypothetical protein